MKNSILFKTALALIISLIVVASIIGSYVYDTQKSIIDELQTNQKNRIIKSLDVSEKTAIAKEMNHLLIMSKSIKGALANALYNANTQSAEETLNLFLQNQNIKAISIMDIAVDEMFLIGYKIDNEVTFSNTLPTQFNKLNNLQYDLIIEDEKIGFFKVFYDNSYIEKNIKELKEKDLNIFNIEAKKIDEKIDEKLRNQAISTILGGLFIVFIVIVLLLKLVNNPLKKLHAGLNEFFLFLQNKNSTTQNIQINSNDEFGQMAEMLNENIAVSAKLHEEIYELNTNLEEKVEEKTQKVTTLLNNAGQGFLTFDKNFIIGDEYSKECNKLLGDSLTGKDIVNILFNDEDTREFVKDTLNSALTEESEIVRKSFVSLLPSSLILNRRALEIEYKILENEQIMLIITNVTAQKKLEKKVKKEQETLKMIVTVVTDSDTFYDTKRDYEDFISSSSEYINNVQTPLHNITRLYRTIHTYKGTFSQLYMKNCVDFLHKIESDISDLIKANDYTNDTLVEFLNELDFNTSLDKDIELLKERLGSEFIDSDNILKVNFKDIKSLQDKIIEIIKDENIYAPQMDDLLEQVQGLSSQKLVNLLSPYVNLTKQLSQRSEKDIYDFNIIGDNKVLVPDEYKPFIKSLIHIFRNSVDHGIESPEIRLENGKDDVGTITCSFNIKNDNLEIVISDDGAGINKEKVTKKAIEVGIITEEKASRLSDSDIYKLIFNDNFSTSDSVSDISGRGVGMSAVKEECEKLNGTIDIQSKPNQGTTFVFTLNLKGKING